MSAPLQPKAIMYLQSRAGLQSFHILPCHRGGGCTQVIFLMTSEDTVSIIPAMDSVVDLIP